MKHFILIISLLMALGASAESVIEPDCTLNGVPLHGNVKVVRHNADFKVQVVQHFADLRVKKVSNFPDECGRWKFVDAFADFTVQFVDHFSDFRIKYVDVFPGLD